MSAEKPLQPADKVVQSLLAYREELLEVARRTGSMPETLFKINSCLFSEYPHGGKAAKEVK